jgi:hypothetical protein
VEFCCGTLYIVGFGHRTLQKSNFAVGHQQNMAFVARTVAGEKGCYELFYLNAQDTQRLQILQTCITAFFIYVISHKKNQLFA